MQQTAGFMRYAATVLCVGLVVCLPPPDFRVTSYAADQDEQTWQGTVTVVRRSHSESDKTQSYPPETDHHVSRSHYDTTATYQGFRLAAENDDMRSWLGSATVNLTVDASTYTFESSSMDSPVAKLYSEQGYDTRTTGSTVAQGVVKFYRYPNQDDPRRTTCRIEVDAADGWRDRPDLNVWEVGRSWSKQVPRPESTNDVWDKPVHEKHTLAPTFMDVSFDCDPKASSYSGRKQTEESGSDASELVTWNLSHRAADPEAVIVPPSGYDSWLPEAGKDESTRGNAITVTVRLHKAGDPSKPAGQKAKFRFVLSDVSEETGVCLNSPLKAKARGGSLWPDLKIDRASNPDLDVSDDGRSATSRDSAKSATVTITSYDWGAYGRLNATALLDGGGEITAHVEGGGELDLTIPRDDNGNHVADSWEKPFALKTFDAEADDDATPHDVGTEAYKGDGLSLYEEYRGFMQQGRHIRTSPLVKDLFVVDEIGRGTGDFAQSGILPHVVTEDEADFEKGPTPNKGVINFNRGFATRGPQHFLELDDVNLPGLYGEAQGDGPGPPWMTRRVAINVAACLERNKEHPGWGNEEVRSTTAHELAHGCNVWHHGETNYDILLWEKLDPKTNTWQAYNYHDGGSAMVASQGGQESGMEQCIMRYVGTTFYESPAGGVRWIKDGAYQYGAYYGPGEAPGHVFCKDQQGTGVNAPGRPGGPKAGNATKGKCRSQFCVNDHAK